MPTLNFNAEEVAPSTGFEAIPAGSYNAVITESAFKPTKSGSGNYLELTFEIIDGEFKNRKLWTRLNLENQNEKAVNIARADLSAICRAVNVMRVNDSAELHNLPLVISVKCRRTPDGELTNEIKGYEPRGGTYSAPQAPSANKSTGAPWAR